MTGTLRVTILGCGSSGGVPRATGDWGVCDPNEPKNRRTRCGLLLQRWTGAPTSTEEATTVLIDTAPELRQQLVAMPDILVAERVHRGHERHEAVGFLELILARGQDSWF